MIINRKAVANMIAKARVIIAKISKGINHASTIVGIELLKNFIGVVGDIKFISDKMQRCCKLLSSFYSLNKSCTKI
jgi:hypothetical protein